MRIVVTGSDGFVGTHLIKRLTQENLNVIKLDIKSGIDIINWKQLNTIPKFDFLIHLASKSFVPDSFKYPKDFYYSNYLGTLNVLELCRKHRAKLIYASSYVYGIPEYLPIDEKHPLKANNPYAQTKIINEKLCEGYNRDFNVPIVILRPFNIYGPGQNENFLIPLIMKQIRRDGKILLKDSRPKRDFVYIDDVVSAYCKAVEYEEIEFEIFNIGSGVSYSVKEISEIIAANYDKDIQIEFSEEKRHNEVMDTIADISKAKNYLHWTPKISLEEGLRKLCIEMNEGKEYKKTLFRRSIMIN